MGIGRSATMPRLRLSNREGVFRAGAHTRARECTAVATAVAAARSAGSVRLTHPFQSEGAGEHRDGRQVQQPRPQLGAEHTRAGAEHRGQVTSKRGSLQVCNMTKPCFLRLGIWGSKPVNPHAGLLQINQTFCRALSAHSWTMASPEQLLARQRYGATWCAM